jgi:hypothetical protein
VDSDRLLRVVQALLSNKHLRDAHGRLRLFMKPFDRASRFSYCGWIGVILLLTGLLGTNLCAADPVRFSAQVRGDDQQDTKISTTFDVRATVKGENTRFLFGRSMWDVSAGTDNGALFAFSRVESVRTSDGGPAPSVGGYANAAIEDVFYLSSGQGVVQVQFTLKLEGACLATPGTNPGGGPKASCSVRLFMALGGNVIFEITEPGEKTQVQFFNTNPSGNELALPISYVLVVQGEANEGVSEGDFVHTAHLYIEPPAGIVFRTESGHSYAAPGPALSVEISGDNILLSWPATTQTYQLESIDGFDAAREWTAVAGAPANVGGQMVVTNAVTTGERFYRLKR